MQSFPKFVNSLEAAERSFEECADALDQDVLDQFAAMGDDAAELLELDADPTPENLARRLELRAALSVADATRNATLAASQEAAADAKAVHELLHKDRRVLAVHFGRMCAVSCFKRTLH
ncbi:hypothetical protein [Ramlibacter alkalitolerans]|uniref:Uncharacterized protein n=1 Tax=Ramlibacter alkalitolerans TaxID=2039631 RepID=A0ABS1JU27_9BURK|nr:hypothetical protein [Ramlibacter alkalitolerans]MBL0427732.1 hypothetical protein [Ramlibacter alkalitolerans]